MELSWSTGVGNKTCPTEEEEIETIPDAVVQETLLAEPSTPRRAKGPRPWSCFYCSADLKVSENAIKAIKSGKGKKDKGGDVADSRTKYHTYQQRKTVGQGMMDLALVTANVNQLRSLLDVKTTHPYYHVNLVFIGISLFFQVIVGISLILNSRVNVNAEMDVEGASRVNNFTFACIFIITITNIFLSVFYDLK